MICEDLGYMILYNRSGKSITLTHEETLDLCLKSQEAGMELPKYIMKNYMKDLKLIKFRYDE
jgi:hypothetical protein